MKKYLPLLIGALTLVLLLALSVGLSQAQEGGPVEGLQPESVDDNVGNYIPVQGRLTNASGSPLDGDFSITFRLYDVLDGGTELCHDTNTVHVENGLFNSEIYGNCVGEVNGQQLYLGIEVGSDGEMEPRQPIYAVPYAWSLKPGAVISATVGGSPILHIENTGSGGRGLRAYASATTGANYGVVGASMSPDGYGGYFYSSGGGIGLKAFTDSALSFGVVGLQPDYSIDDLTDSYWESGGFFGGTNGVVGISHETVRVGAGVFGWVQGSSGNGYGVYGRSDATDGEGVYGYASATTGITRGVYGRSESPTGRGVYGLADANTGDNYGVFGETDSSTGHGVHGLADSTAGGVGVYGQSDGVGSGVYGGSVDGFGVYALSNANNAVYADTQKADHNYGVYTPDNSYSSNYHARGAMMFIVQNGGAEAIEPGDVVTFIGLTTPAGADDLPVALVARAADGASIAGVVVSRSTLEGGSTEGAVPPGEYLLIAVQGMARVKASAVNGAIQPGDALTLAALPGSAAKMDAAQAGIVIGTALEALPDGDGWIYVFLILR